MGVVCDDAEARIGRVFLHDAPEGHLRRTRHGVGFVEDDEFVGRQTLGCGWVCGYGGEDLFGACGELVGQYVAEPREREGRQSCEKGFASRGDILAKVLICSRTTSMPLSSLALSSRTI